jgi:hypothetical protein
LLKIRYDERIRERVNAKCPRHPRYDPESEGKNGVRDRCSTCYSLLAIHEARLELDSAIREFHRRAAPWQIIPSKKKVKHTAAPDGDPETQIG